MQLNLLHVVTAFERPGRQEKNVITQVVPRGKLIPMRGRKKAILLFTIKQKRRAVDEVQHPIQQKFQALLMRIVVVSVNLQQLREAPK